LNLIKSHRFIRSFRFKLLALFIGVSGFQHLTPPVNELAVAESQIKDATALMEKEKYEAAIPVLKEAISVFEKVKDGERYLAACRKLDDCFYSSGLYEESIAFFTNALKSAASFHNEPQLKARFFFIIGYTYNDLRKDNKAIGIYTQGLPFAEAARDTGLLTTYYYNLGRLYWETGNHDDGLVLQLKALAFFQQMGRVEHIPTLLYYIGDSYRTMDNPIAFDYFRQSIALNRLDPQAWIQFSKAYEEFGKPDSALIVLNQVLPLLQDHEEKADAFYQFARIYKDVPDLEKANRYIEKALYHGQEGYGESDIQFARINALAGKIYLASKNPDDALTWFHQNLLRQSNGVPEDLDITKNPELGQLSPGSFWVLSSLDGKGEAFYQKYLQTKDSKNLEYALAAFDSALTYGENMRLSYGHESSKTDLYEYLNPAVSGGIEAAMAMAAATGNPIWHEKAFAFAERVKAAVMAEALYDKSIKHLAGIEDSVLEMERLWEDSVVTLEMLAYEEPENPSHRDALTDAYMELTRVKDQMGKTNPRYYALKYAFEKTADIRQIQKNLGDGDLLVEYFKGDSTLYTFALSKTELKAYATPATAVFDTTLGQFRRSISDWDYLLSDGAAAEQDFLASAPKLYEWLLAKPLSEFKATRLIIVPDGALGLLSFNALLTKPHTGSWTDLNLPYLLHEFSISYAWSAGAIRPHREAGAEMRNNFGGFGTRYEQEDTLTAPIAMRRALGPLRFAPEEVKTAGELLGGQYWLNAAATKDNFLAHALDCGILHIATHGILDDDNPMRSYLAFDKTNAAAENRLFASELYTLELHAALVVLSACNTGSGKIAGGEGNMSIARAFAYAGCPTLVSNLWSANDQASAMLMAHFYKVLKTGVPVDEALNQATRQYLKETTAASAIPAYWANLVVIGQCDPLFGPSALWWKIAAGLLLGAGFLYLLYRRNIIPFLAR